MDNPFVRMRRMRSFSPSEPAIVFDELNDKLFCWKPEWADSYEEHRTVHDRERGVIEWDGLLLAGWFDESEAIALGFSREEHGLGVKPFLKPELEAA